MMNNKSDKKSCKTCVHSKLPANCEVCKDCWNYRRWGNWEPVGGERR